MKTVYLSGPMSGIAEHNFPAFFAAAETLRAQGVAVFNPAEVDQGPAPTWESCLRNDIRELVKCDALVLLPGWQNSRGARLEAFIARSLSMPVSDYAGAAPDERAKPWPHGGELSHAERRIAGKFAGADWPVL